MLLNAVHDAGREDALVESERQPIVRWQLDLPDQLLVVTFEPSRERGDGASAACPIRTTLTTEAI
jgi:hypothetical protein